MRDYLIPICLAVALLGTLPLSAGCSGVGFQPELSEPSRLYLDQWVRTSPLNVSVRPVNGAHGATSALFLPFRVQQQMDSPRHQGREMMRLFWTGWTGREVLPTMVYDETLYFASGAQAAREARARGADLAVCGVVSYLLDGGSSADTAVSLRLEVYDAATGGLVWSMEQYGAMQADLVQDYILFARRTRLPTAPLTAVLDDIARQMAQPVAAWNRGLPPGSG